jgi:hypothetical protein
MINTLEILGYISGLGMVITAIPYIIDIIKGKTKPERASWFIWALLMVVSAFSQIAKGGTYSVLFTIFNGIGVSTIALLSIKYGVGGFTKRDKIGLCGVVLSLILWYLTNEPAVALILVILIDFIGAVLTIIKAYEHPESETLSMWLWAGVFGTIGAISVGSWNPILIAFPIYVGAIDLITAFVIIIARNKLKSRLL